MSKDSEQLIVEPGTDCDSRLQASRSLVADASVYSELASNAPNLVGLGNTSSLLADSPETPKAGQTENPDFRSPSHLDSYSDSDSQQTSSVESSASSKDLANAPASARNTNSEAPVSEGNRRAGLESSSEFYSLTSNMTSNKASNLELEDSDLGSGVFAIRPNKLGKSSSSLLAAVGSEDPLNKGIGGEGEAKKTPHFETLDIDGGETQFAQDIVEDSGMDTKVADFTDSFKKSDSAIRRKGASSRLRRKTEGTDFAGFTILERIAEGGMGVIFKACQEALNRVVAIKVLKEHKIQSSNARLRFIQEAESAASLRHPNIVPIHEISEIDGFAYYVMDFVQGLPLHVAVQNRSFDGKDIARLMASIAGAVQHFHTRGIIHRDLKPDNILVRTDDDEPIIIDFGVAKNAHAEYQNLTIDGAVLGTPQYMAPEQARGDQTEVDTRSDIYALGTILFQLLTGQLPFATVDPKVLLYAIMSEEPPTPQSIKHDIPWELSAIVMKAMEKTPSNRYQSALEFRDDLLRYCNDEPVVAKNAGYLYKIRKFGRRNQRSLLVTLLVVLLVLRVAVYGVSSRLALIDQEIRLAHLKADKERKAKLYQKRQLQAEKAARKSEQKVAIADRKLAEALQKQQRLELEARELEEKQRLAFERTQLDQALRLIQGHKKQTPLKAINSLQHALILIGEKDECLRIQAEQDKFKLHIQLTKSAIQNKQLFMADYWLQGLEFLKITKSDDVLKAKLVSLKKEIAELKAKQNYLALATEAYKRNDIAAAIQNLARAKEQGVVDSIEFRDLQDLVFKAQQKQIERLLERSREALKQLDFRQSWILSGDALEIDQNSIVAQKFRSLVLSKIIRQAELKSVEASLDGDPGTKAIDILRGFRDIFENQDACAVLNEQLRHRQYKIDHKILKSYVYVPAMEQFGSRGFFIAKYEVTREQYRQFVDEGGYLERRYWDKEYSLVARTARHWLRTTKGANSNPQLPIRDINLYEARAYTRWLSKKYQLKFRLPTAKEWELAAGWDFSNQRFTKFPGHDNFRESMYRGPNPVPVAVNDKNLDLSYWQVRGLGLNVREWVDSDLAGTIQASVKGSDFLASTQQSEHFASIRTSSSPGPVPIKEVATRIGIRVVCEPE